jgi:hypothetical protein
MHASTFWLLLSVWINTPGKKINNKKNVCLLSPDRPYFFTRTLKFFIEKNYNILETITVEIVFKTVNKYKNTTNNNSKNPNSLNYKFEKKNIKKIKKIRPTDPIFFLSSDSKDTYFILFFCLTLIQLSLSLSEKGAHWIWIRKQ